MVEDRLVEKYIVVKPFGFLRKGDILTLDGCLYIFSDEKSADNNDYYSKVNVAFSIEMAQQYEKSGLIEAVEEDSNTVADNKLKKIAKLISTLKNTYDKRNKNIAKSYEDGKIQTCVKVEHDTVYFNMMKLLNKIESIVNE